MRVNCEEEELLQHQVEDLNMEDDSSLETITNTIIFHAILQTVKQDVDRVLKTPAGIRGTSNYNEGCDTTYSEWCTFYYEPLSREMHGPMDVPRLFL